MFGGLTHEPAARLAQLLVDITPDGLDTVFFSDSGSVSVEVAVKMALQYWRSLDRPKKHRLMTWRGGYHGDTFTPMSVCDPDGGMHSLWTDVLAHQVFAPQVPTDYDPDYSAAFEAQLTEHADELAAVIVEPVVQGAGGMRFHDPRYLTDLRDICDRHEVLLIFDEIATGFGRTGTLFAAEHAGVSPDIMCVGKALTGGYITLAATLCTTRHRAHDQRPRARRADARPDLHGQRARVLGGGGVGRASARPGLAGTGSGDRSGTARRSRAGPVRCPVWPTSGCSAPSASSRWTEPVDMPVATAAALRHGIWLRPFRNLIYAMPPYICTPEEIGQITSAMVAVADSLG